MTTVAESLHTASEWEQIRKVIEQARAEERERIRSLIRRELDAAPIQNAHTAVVLGIILEKVCPCKPP